MWKKTHNFYEIDKSELKMIDGKVKLPLFNKVINFINFQRILSSQGDVLYYLYVIKGPGIHENKYLIWNR